MTHGENAAKGGGKRPAGREERRKRLAAQLRENLRKRKTRARAEAEEAQKPPQTRAKD